MTSSVFLTKSQNLLRPSEHPIPRLDELRELLVKTDSTINKTSSQEVSGQEMGRSVGEIIALKHFLHLFRGNGRAPRRP